MLDIILVVVLCIFAIVGLKRGLVSTLFSFLKYVLSLILAFFLYPYVTSFLMKTPIATYITTFLDENLKFESVPSILQPFIQEQTSSIMVSFIMSIISIVLLFVVISLVLRFAKGVLNSIAHIPILNMINRLGGLVAGVLIGVLMIYLAFSIQAIVQNDSVNQIISYSKWGKEMYNNNLIFQFMIK